jgi:murein DD-endopeptidase MepM/ murein hydrolase activator NlpD
MQFQNKKKIFVFLFGLIFILGSIAILSVAPDTVSANGEEIDRLNAQIDEKRIELEKLDAEIAKQRQAVQQASGRANNLQGNINQLELTRSKILSDIDETETKIEKAELTLTKLELEIREKEDLIQRGSVSLSASVRKIKNMRASSFVEQILGYENISDFWAEFERTEKIHNDLNLELDSLKDLYEKLQKQETAKINEKEQLAKYQVELSGEKVAVEYTKEEKAKLLVATRNEEAAYQKILQEKLREKRAFEEELLEIESKLQILIDPESYPEARKGILAWPVDNVIITQYFGGTAFAKTNPHVYGRAFHPGVDFGVPIGTRIKSVYDGTVVGFGNTDAYPGCRAWGKWILVEHPNGLSSLYAHLSSISVSKGQSVKRGETIALSGNTGISTGPHLHLTIYASQGVTVGRYGDYKSGSGCAATGATGPFADLDAYLDPIEYLPN